MEQTHCNPGCHVTVAVTTCVILDVAGAMSPFAVSSAHLVHTVEEGPIRAEHCDVASAAEVNLPLSAPCVDIDRVQRAAPEIDARSRQHQQRLEWEVAVVILVRPVLATLGVGEQHILRV